MKYIPFIFLLAFHSLAQFPPAVLVNTNGVVQYPTNFFVANSNALVSVVGQAGVTDGDKGDITVSSGVWTVDAAAIAYAKIQDVSAASKLLGRGSAGGSGDVEEISAGSGLTMTGTTLSVAVPVSAGDKGDVTVATPGGGDFTLAIDNDSVSYAKLQNVGAASRLLGRGAYFGSGDVEEITLGTGFDLDGTTLNINATNTTVSVAGGIEYLASMEDLVYVVSSDTNHLNAYFIRGYWDEYPGVGGGIWYYDSTSDYPTNRAVIESVNGGRFFPKLYNNLIDITRFGAVSLGSPSTYTDTAIQNALLMQQDHTFKDGKVLFFPEGVWRVTSTITERTPGTASSASTKYLVNNSGGYTTGDTTIAVDTGSGTILAGDMVQFGTTETLDTYRVKTALSGGSFTIHAPGLRASVADNATVYVRPDAPLVMKGVNNGISLDSNIRGQMASEIFMETGNIPIIQAQTRHHGRIEDLSLAYSSTQFPASSSAACIYSGPNDEFFQWTVRGVTMNRGAYGIHIAESAAGANNGAANNRFDDIIVRAATISGVTIKKAGTGNKLGYWYIQNNGFSMTNGVAAANHLQNITNATKVTPGTEVVLNLQDTPGALQVGSFAVLNISGVTNLQVFIKTLTNNVATIDLPSTYSTNTLAHNTGTLENVAKSQASQPNVYIGAGFEFDAQAMDVEGNVGTTTANQPVLMDIRGEGFIGFLHMEYAFPKGANQALFRNAGGHVVIGAARVVNCGRLAELTSFVFENNTLDLSGSGTKGYLSVGHLGIYDFSTMTSSSGTWLIQTNKNSCDPVVIGKYTRLPVIRQNASSTWNVNGAQSPSLTTLP